VTSEFDTGIQLRSLTPQEFADYRDRSVPAYAEEVARARDVELSAALRNAEETFPSSLADVAATGQEIYRAVHEGSDVGWLWLGPPPFGGPGRYVYDVEIDEEHRGEGLGRALMLTAEAVARESGYARLGLNVFGWNSRAESLYRSLGYEVMSTQMVKRLGNEMLDGDLPDGDTTLEGGR
jgi:ribosomal protein S18 acetylase RimI-like enzyme